MSSIFVPCLQFFCCTDYLTHGTHVNAGGLNGSILLGLQFFVLLLELGDFVLEGLFCFFAGGGLGVDHLLKLGREWGGEGTVERWMRMRM